MATKKKHQIPPQFLKNQGKFGKKSDGDGDEPGGAMSAAEAKRSAIFKKKH